MKLFFILIAEDWKNKHNLFEKDELYCYCNYKSYDTMIKCDGAKCAINWFHLNCVNLHKIPEGTWYCNECRQQKHNIEKEKKWCLCNQKHEWISGKMIKCDNNKCKIQWFHYKCVNILKRPKKIWYCNDCIIETKLINCNLNANKI